jgi:DNA mismatch repair protein MutS
VLGYFVEVTAQHGEKLMAPPLNAQFIHRQTLAGQVRFTTTELGDLEAKIASAADRALGLELEIFERLSARVVAASVDIKAAAEALAMLDVSAALAALASEKDYVRPEIDRGLRFDVKGARHPVVEQALAQTAPFIANDCDLSPPAKERAGRIWVLTGPNMAGKSTFLRQNALIVILAQMGGFVPAKSAHIGAVDRLFSRVGAADDLARGRSTFMVEMVETAAILNQASERSLVILDEIGRGTATFDGLFLHEVVAGAADRSYGIQVAKLAGLPGSVIERAKIVLAELESEQRKRPLKGFDDLPLFQAAPVAAAPRETPLDKVITALEALHPDEMSPREAMDALYALKQKLGETKKP